MEIYLHANSPHSPPIKKICVIKTLATRTFRISKEYLKENEKNHLIKFFKNLVYNKKDITNSLQKYLDRSNDNPHSKSIQGLGNTSYLPYLKGTIDRISKVLKQKETITSFIPLTIIKQKMKFVRDNEDNFQNTGVYKIECSCRKCYSGEIGCSLHVRIKEHGDDFKPKRIRNSTLEKHAKTTNIILFLEGVKIIAKYNH